MNKQPKPAQVCACERRAASMAALVLLVSGFLCSLVAMAAPAGAHSDKGSIVIINKEPAGPLGIRYVVEITFASDGHRAPDAVATLVAESDGEKIGPLPLKPVEGKTGEYEVTAMFSSSGDWNTRFTSLDPAAVLEITEYLGVVSDPSAATTRVAAEPVSVDPSAPDTALKKDSGNGGVVGLLALALASAGAVFVLRRARSADKP